MNILKLLPLFSVLFLLVQKIEAQTCYSADAGPDKAICSGGSTLIGSATVSGCEYSWSPTTGLNNPNIAQPQASPTSTTTYTLTQKGANLLSNPGFESGNTGFSSDLSYVTSYPQPSEYAVLDDVNQTPCLNKPYSGTLLFVATAPNTNPSNYRVWYETFNISQNVDYNFSGFFRNHSYLYSTNVEARITGNNTGTSTTSYTLSNYCEIWDNFSVNWNSGINTSVTVEFRITSAGSNHRILLDDLRFSCVTTDQVTVNLTTATSVTPTGPITYYNQYESTTDVVLTSSSAPPYQWYKNGTAISGATNQTYTIASSQNLTYTDYYYCVTPCGTSNTVTFNYVGCDNPSDYPVTITNNYCASQLPATITAPNPGSSPTYYWYKSNPFSCWRLPRSNTSSNTLSQVGCSTPSTEGLYSRAVAANGTEIWMYWVVTVNMACRPGNSGSLLPVRNVLSEVEYSIFQNPAKDKITIKNSKSITRIEVYNSSGQLLRSAAYNHSSQVDMNASAFSNGTYLLKIYSDKGVETKKIVIQK